jgi:NitT/TauT family transport system ATP-binding protein
MTSLAVAPVAAGMPAPPDGVDATTEIAPSRLGTLRTVAMNPDAVRCKDAVVDAPSRPPPHATLHQVTQVFPGRNGAAPLHALGPIDLDIGRGEFFAVVGPSGCGKSTLLDILAGLVRPASGQVVFEGRLVEGVPDGVGAVFQEDASFPWLTVADNIAFGLRRAHVAAAETKRRVDYALGFMGLRDFAGFYPAQLSGGMRQRVCIARTLVLQPRFILLDEPFGALDQQTRLLMGDELLRLWRETGATVLLITHALDEATMLADRVGVMSARPGRFIDIVETGWPRDRDSRVVSNPAFGAITARIWSTLREEAMKLMTSPAAAP